MKSVKIAASAKSRIRIHTPKRARVRTHPHLLTASAPRIQRTARVVRLAQRSSAISPARASAPAPAPTSISPNYTARVLARQFEPTALRARLIAQSRNQSLHELAHELGYAPAPPRVRRPVDLRAVSRTELARASKLSLSDLSRMLSRRHPPMIGRLALVARALDAWMDDVLVAIGW